MGESSRDRAASRCRQPEIILRLVSVVNLVSWRRFDHGEDPLELMIQVRMLRGPAASSQTTYSFSFVDSDRLIVGRSSGCDLLVDHPTVTARHCKVSMSAGVLWLEDLESENGTFVNERRISDGRRAMVQPGDVVRIGPALLCFGTAAESVTQGGGTSTHALAIEFVQQVMESGAEEPPRIEVVGGPGLGLQTAVPRSQVIVIGRDPGCHVFVDDPDISHRHAKLYTDADGCWLTDLHSKNGTRVDGRVIAGHWKLQSGQTIEVGSSRIVFVDPAEEYLKVLDAAAGAAQAAVPDGSPEAKIVGYDGVDEVRTFGGDEEASKSVDDSSFLQDLTDNKANRLQSPRSGRPSGTSGLDDVDEEGGQKGIAARAEEGQDSAERSKGPGMEQASKPAGQQGRGMTHVRSAAVFPGAFTEAFMWKWWVAGAVGILFVFLAIGGLVYLLLAV